ncbi:MAG: VanW family protein [Bacteroidales bacterium]|nr:VanW family protein [Bacteroidales bacterium]
MRKRLFCEISPLTYAISLHKEILRRHLKDLLSRLHFARTRQEERLPVLVASHHNNMIKRGPGINAEHQRNKADNIRLACSKMNGLLVRPGETFSFWQLVGKTSRRNGFAEGRVLINGRLVAGVGGGLCNLANTINLVVMHSPLTITEVHHHSDALAPDPDGIRVPYSAGTSVNYNYIDYRFLNATDQTVQLCLWCESDDLHAELRSERPFPYTYRLVEENHHFHQEHNGKFYRISQIYRETFQRESSLEANTATPPLHRELLWDNHSEVLFDYTLIPKEQIR